MVQTPQPPMAGPPANTSGQGPGAAVPPEIQGWCWGGFLLSWIWALVHKAWIGLILSLLLGIVGNIFCGIKGNEWAWQNCHYDSVAEFREIQAKWTKAGIILVVVSLVLAFVVVLIAFGIMLVAGSQAGA